MTKLVSGKLSKNPLISRLLHYGNQSKFGGPPNSRIGKQAKCEWNSPYIIMIVALQFAPHRSCSQHTNLGTLDLLTLKDKRVGMNFPFKVPNVLKIQFYNYFGWVRYIFSYRYPYFVCSIKICAIIIMSKSSKNLNTHIFFPVRNCIIGRGFNLLYMCLKK